MDSPHYILDEMDLFVQQNIEDENSVPSEYDKTQYSQADIYYKFRYTFAEDVQGDLNCQKLQTNRLIGLLSKFMLENKYTVGIEWFTRGMVDAKHHVHIHFTSRTKKDTIVKALKRADKDEEVLLFHSNRCYALGREVDVCVDKFWRYPFKQQKNDTRKFMAVRGIAKPVALVLRDVAYDCWVTASEIMNKKIEKKEDSDQLSTRLYAFLDKKDTSTDIKIKIEIQKFYIEEEDKPFNRSTALGYFYNYKITRKKMTHEELAALW